jgi:hypothetical protein
MITLIKYQKMMMLAKLSSRFKLSSDSIWVVVDNRDLVEAVEASVEVVVVDNNNQRKKAMTITKSLVSRETPQKKKSKRSLRKWQSNIIQIKMQMIPKQPKRNFRKLQMHMKH